MIEAVFENVAVAASAGRLAPIDPRWTQASALRVRDDDPGPVADASRRSQGWLFSVWAVEAGRIGQDGSDGATRLVIGFAQGACSDGMQPRARSHVLLMNNGIQAVVRTIDSLFFAEQDVQGCNRREMCLPSRWPCTLGGKRVHRAYGRTFLCVLDVDGTISEHLHLVRSLYFRQ